MVVFHWDGNHRKTSQKTVRGDISLLINLRMSMHIVVFVKSNVVAITADSSLCNVNVGLSALLSETFHFRVFFFETEQYYFT